MTRHLSRLVRFFGTKEIAVVCLAAVAWAVRPAAGADDAREALTAAGVKGGLVVHLGCGDGKGTVQLRAGEAFIVQGLDVSAEKVQEARKTIAAAGVYGDVTAREYDGRSLPFVEGTVNLLVVDDPASVPNDEMTRVLCPRGAICTREGGRWKVQSKPWPDGMDEWTHYQHDPQGTMVGKDKLVGPPRRIQWLGDPKWLRNHDFMSSMNALVSSQGRIFYIIDEGLRNHIFLPARWSLIARDGFNGVILWKRPLKDWHPTNWPLKSGPGYLPRRLVAVGGTVFATLGLIEPLTAMDAATGQTIRTYDGTRATEEILFADGVLYLLTDPNRQPVGYRAETATYTEIKSANTGWGWNRDRPTRTIQAVQADSGKVLWSHTAKVAPLSLTVADKRVAFFDGDHMVALDRTTGRPDWATELPVRLLLPGATGAAPRVVYSDGVLLVDQGTQTFAFAADGGKLLWQGKTLPSGHFCPNDLFVIDGKIWSAHTGAAQKAGTHLTALDLHTGAVSKDLVAENLSAFPMHPRCYPSRATEKYLLTAGMGTEFYPVGGNSVELHNYVRGSCIYGIMPCNGLLYKPPDSCACYEMSKLEYFCALAPAGPAAQPVPDDRRLQKGPAYSAALAKPPAAPAGGEDWPMYRHDPARSGFSPSAAPAELKKAWEVQLGGRLTQPVVAGGKAYVASVDAHTLYALDADGGKTLWTFTTGGRIDSPPTIDQGRAIFGSADGWVYCLRADDGALAWRRLVAPEDRQIISRQQPESVWPVSGSVLVHGGTIYALAGRNMFFDGGMRLVRLDAATGTKLSETVLNDLDPATGKNLQTLIVGKSMPVANPDILSCDGKSIYMQAQRFDLEGKRPTVTPMPPARAIIDGQTMHLFCSTGFLDDMWFHRSYWTYAENFPEGWSEYNRAWNQAPSGRIMALDETRAYGFRPDKLGNTLLPEPTYRLYAADRKAQVPTTKDAPGPGRGATPAALLDSSAGPLGGEGPEGARGRRGGTRPGPASQPGKDGDGAAPGPIAGPFKVYWQIQSPPLLVNAMAVGAKRLFVAGPPDVADESKMLGFLPGADDDINRQLKAQEEAWRGKMGGLLWVLSAEDGTKQAEYKLDALPVWDGMSVAGGRLFVSFQNGAVACWDRK